jgi:hypothetical protein
MEHPSLDLMKKAEERYAVTLDLVAALTEKLATDDAAFSDAVAADDPQAEAAAYKQKTVARDALAKAQERLPLLAEAVNVARRDACGPHAEEAVPVLAQINAEAKDAAAVLCSLHKGMIEVAKEITQMAGRHAEAKNAHFALCTAAGMRPPFEGAASLGVEARFSVNERYLAQRVNVYQPKHLRLELAALLNGAVEDADDAAL